MRSDRGSPREPLTESASHADRGARKSGCNGRPPHPSWIIHFGRAEVATHEGRPAVASMSHRGFTHLGLDVSRDSISVAVLEPSADVPVVDKIMFDEPSVRKLVGRFPSRKRVWVCYEA